MDNCKTLAKNKNRITLRDIAELSGVSRSTVGHVLSGRAKKLRIAEKTQEKVKKVAQKHGYLANFAVQQLRSSKTFQIAYVSNPRNAKTVSPAVFNMIDCLQKHNYHTSFIFSESTPPVMLERRFDGMVIEGVCSTRQFFVDWCEEYKVPYIFLNHEEATLNHVGVDDQGTMNQLIDELYVMGFRKIAYYFPRNISSSPLFPADYIFKREQYFINALKARSLPMYPNSVEQRLSSTSPLKFLINQPTPPECVVTYDNFHAIGFIDKAKELGIKVPNDVAVVAFDINKYNISIKPSICGIQFNFDEIGENLADMILERINTGKNLKKRLTTGKLVFKRADISLDSLDYFNRK